MVEILPLFLLVGLVALTEGVPKGSRHHTHAKKEEEPAKSRSYIDIDASDPFKVPKSSHYINRPIPEFSQAKEEKVEEEASEHSDHHGEREHETYAPSKDMEPSEEEMKDMEVSHERPDHEHEHEHEGDEKEGSEKSHDSPDEHESNAEENSQDEPNTSSILSKETDLPAEVKSLGNLEQDAQSIQKSIQNVEPLTDQGTDEGYKKTLTSTDDEGTTTSNEH